MAFASRSVVGARADARSKARRGLSGVSHGCQFPLGSALGASTGAGGGPVNHW